MNNTKIDGIPEVVKAHGLRAFHPRPLVSHGKGGGGFSSHRVPPDQAWTYPEIQLAHAGSAYAALALDCDRPGAAQDAILSGAVPVPSWQVIRKSNGHRHVVYVLAEPVHRHDAARRGPLEYLGHIERYYIAALGADPGYRGILTHNPVHAPGGPESPYVTRWGRGQPFTLDELADVIPANWTPPTIRDGPVGRNVDLFNGLMDWAGRADKRGLSVHAAAVELNRQFDDPLPASEVRATARSVAGYRRKWIAQGWHSRRFLARQSARGRASGQARRTARLIRSVPILGDHVTGLDTRTIAARHGVSVSTVERTTRATRHEPTQIGGPVDLGIIFCLALAWRMGRIAEDEFLTNQPNR